MNKILKSGMMLALALLAMSCNKEDLPGNGEEVNGGVLTINVVDKGYASQDSVPETKATTDGSYKTTFGEGDEIGVYVVSSLEGNQILLNNEKLTYSSSGWTGDLRYKKIEGDSPKFFAYYPYDGSISAEKITASAENAEVFFATYLSGITLPTDQSDAGKYSKADIMVGDGVLAGTALTFGMEHQMGLVVIEIPKKFETGELYYLDQDPEYTWLGEGSTESTVSVPEFTGITPLDLSQGDEKYTYRYLVNPLAEVKSSITGNFNLNGTDNKNIEITTDRFPTSGGYKVYSVGLGDGALIEKEHKLAVGDFFMNDGSLVGKDVMLTEEQKGKCIGIVFQTDVTRIGEAEKTALLENKGVSSPHGLVMALKEAADTNNQVQWKITNDGDDVITICRTRDNCKNDISGLENYNDVKKKNSDLSSFPAFKAAENYNLEVNVDLLRTTGWFIPSVGQWWDILKNLGDADFDECTDNTGDSDDVLAYSYMSVAADKIDDILEKVYVENLDNVDIFDRNADGGSNPPRMWTSSEYEKNSARCVVFATNLLGQLILDVDQKTTEHRVRCVFAF